MLLHFLVYSVISYVVHVWVTEMSIQKWLRPYVLRNDQVLCTMFYKIVIFSNGFVIVGALRDA